MRATVLLGSVGLLLGACFDPSIPVGLPCTDTRACPDGQRCDPVTDTCTLDPVDVGAWRDDTEADFAAAGASFEGTATEAPGVVAPAPYLTGGLLLRGARGLAFTDASTATWAQVAVLTPLGEGVLRDAELDRGTGRPYGVGLTGAGDGDNVTVWFEGELWLARGSHELRLTGDDDTFVELGQGFTTRLSSAGAVSTTATFVAPEAAWYPIRGALADASGALLFRLETRPGGGSFQPVSRDAFRVPIATRQGFVVDAFDDAGLVGFNASTLAPSLSAPTDDDLSTGIGLEQASLRYSGQLRIDVDGEYQLRLDSRGGHRAWLDGALVADALTALTPRTDTSPRSLSRGWHELVVDLDWPTGASGTPRVELSVVSGPELAGQPFPLARTRPVIGRGLRWASDYRANNNIPDNGSVSETCPIVAPANAVPVSASVYYSLIHPALGTLRVVLDPPDAAPLTLHDPGTGTALTGSGNFETTRSFPTDPPGAGGAWTMTVTDTVSGGNGNFDFFHVLANYRGGEPPIPTTTRYTSAVRDLGEVAALGPVRWTLRQATGGGATVRVRTCASAEACTDQNWVAVAASGDTPAVAPGRFAQYQVDLTSNGDVATALDWIELTYQPN